jgi:hypothetical protein
MRWAPYAEGSCKQLLAGLHRWSQVPRRLQLHLTHSANFGQVVRSAGFPLHDLVWYQPVWNMQTTTPVEIYMSRHYHRLNHLTSSRSAPKVDRSPASRFPLALPPPRAEWRETLRSEQTSPLDRSNGPMTVLDGLSPSRQAVSGDAIPSLRSLFPSLTRIAPLPLGLWRPSQRHAHGHIPTAIEADETQAELSRLPSLTWRNQPSPTGHDPAPESNPATSLVDSLFDQAMQQRVTSDLSLRMLPQPVANSRNRVTDSVSAISRQSDPHMPKTAPLTMPLNRSDVTQIADQVARMLKQQARLERERGGHY